MLSSVLVSTRQPAAVATAFMLPLSTTGQAVCVSIFLICALATLDTAALLATTRRLAGLLPVLLFSLLCLGLLWTPESVAFSIKWISPYAKLLLIPVLLASRFSTRQVIQIGSGFVAACTILLMLSWASFIWPGDLWNWFKSPGVPFKDNAVQSGFFALCAFGMANGAVRLWSEGKKRGAVLAIALAILFFTDIFLIFISKTGVLICLALLILFLSRLDRRRYFVVAPLLVVIGLALWSSAPAQLRIKEFWTDIHTTDSAKESVSTAARLDFWKKGVALVWAAPVLGHGTGSIKSLYAALETSAPSPYGEATPDPHNQFIGISLQLGLVGGLLLLAMWWVHFQMFRGHQLLNLFGQAIVLQNVIGSAFNSHIATVSQGMLYCLAVGFLGSAIRSRQDCTQVEASARPPLAGGGVAFDLPA